MPKLKLNVLHPTNGTDINIETDSSVTVGEVLFELVQNNFLAGGLSYSVSVGKDEAPAALTDHNLSMKELGIPDDGILMIRVAQPDVPRPPAPPQKPDNTRDGDAEAAAADEEAPPAGELAPASEEETMREILQDYARVLTENAQWTKRHELEYKNFCDERTKLENKVRSCERQLGEKKIAAVVLVIAQVVVGLGAAYVTASLMPSIFTIAAGFLMTAAGLWLVFRKGR